MVQETERLSSKMQLIIINLNGTMGSVDHIGQYRSNLSLE